MCDCFCAGFAGFSLPGFSRYIRLPTPEFDQQRDPKTGEEAFITNTQPGTSGADQDTFKHAVTKSRDGNQDVALQTLGALCE